MIIELWGKEPPLSNYEATECINVRTSGRWQEVIYGHEIADAPPADFDYIALSDWGYREFVRIGGELYDLGDWHGTYLDGWGLMAESAWSGVALQWDAELDKVRVGTYWAGEPNLPRYFGVLRHSNIAWPWDEWVGIDSLQHAREVLWHISGWPYRMPDHVVWHDDGYGRVRPKYTEGLAMPACHEGLSIDLYRTTGDKEAAVGDYPDRILTVTSRGIRDERC